MRARIKLVIAAAVILSAALLWWRHAGQGEDSLEAWVDGRPVIVSARVSAFVEEVPVREGNQVKTGDLLFRQDDSALRVALAEERGRAAQLAQGLSAESLGEAARSGSAGADDLPAQLAAALQAEEDSRRALQQLSTQEAQSALALAGLRNRYTGTAEQKNRLKNAEQAHKAAKIRSEAAREDFERAARQRAHLDRKILERKNAGAVASRQSGQSEEVRAREYETQLARVALAEKNLLAAQAVSPADGFVTRLNVKAGELLASGAPALELTPTNPDQLWVMALYSKEQAQKILLGQPGEVLLPDLGNEAMPGIVIGKGLPGDPVITPDGKTIKDAVPVRLALQPQDVPPPALKPGLTAKVTVFANAPTAGGTPAPEPGEPEKTE